MPILNNIKNKKDPTTSDVKRDKTTDPFYYSTRWRKLRRIKLQHNPLCEVCVSFGKLIKATVIDHHIPRRFDDSKSMDIDNLTSMCDRHHAQKSSLEGKTNNIDEWLTMINKSKFKKGQG